MTQNANLRRPEELLPKPQTPLFDQLAAERKAVEEYATQEAARQKQQDEHYKREAAARPIREQEAARLAAVHAQAIDTIEATVEVLLGAIAQYADSATGPRYAAINKVQSYLVAKLRPVIGEMPPMPLGPDTSL